MQKLTKFAEEGDTLYKKKKKNGNDNNDPFAPTRTGAIVRTSKKNSIRYFALNAGHFIKYKWLLKDSNGKLFCKPCTQVPEISKQSDKFVKGWAGNNQRFKDESFARSINITNTHWVTGVYSNRTNQRLYYADTWGTHESTRARMPANLLEKINYFLSQQLPPAPCAYTEILETPPQQQNSCGSCVDVFARRLGEGTFDFVLGV